MPWPSSFSGVAAFFLSLAFSRQQAAGNANAAAGVATSTSLQAIFENCATSLSSSSGTTCSLGCTIASAAGAAAAAAALSFLT